MVGGPVGGPLVRLLQHVRLAGLEKTLRHGLLFAARHRRRLAQYARRYVLGAGASELLVRLLARVEHVAGQVAARVQRLQVLHVVRHQVADVVLVVAFARALHEQAPAARVVVGVVGASSAAAAARVPRVAHRRRGRLDEPVQRHLAARKSSSCWWLLRKMLAAPAVRSYK